MELQDNYFKDLKSQLVDKNKWDASKFSVFSYEAGLGKSRNTQRFLAEINDKTLYVQKFSKDNALDNTASYINEIAGKEVAVAFTSEHTKSPNHIKRACDAQVLCITTRMYFQICKGLHEKLINNRSILIIDEYPELLEQLKFTINDLGILWSQITTYGYKETDELAYELRTIMLKYAKENALNNRMDMIFFTISESEKYLTVLEKLLKHTKQFKHKERKQLIYKLIQMLKNGFYYSEGCLYTFDSNIEFKMLECNIILDANENDYRYELSKKFEVMKQQKHLDYSKAEFHHFEIDTSKKSLKSYSNLVEAVLTKINFDNTDSGVLFVTEKSQKESVEEAIQNYFRDQVNITCPIAVDYFGNLIGKNDYRTFNKVVILKTPNFDYQTYAMTNFFYKYHDNVSVSNIKVFHDVETEKIRYSIVAGEIYQAVRRIARDDLDNAQIYVLNNNETVVDMVVNQLPGIQYSKSELHVNKVSSKSLKDATTVFMPTKFEVAAEEVKKILMDAKEKNIKFLYKKDVRNQVAISNNANFSKVLKYLYSFFFNNNIENKGQKLIVN